MARLSTIQTETKFATPVGAVKACASGNIPAGWLECNGATLDAVTTTSFQRLFDNIGIVYGGTGNTNFNIPDLRGEFVRGLDNGRGVDVGRTNGTAQSNQLGQHTHPSGSLSANGANAPHGHPAGGVGGVNVPHGHGAAAGNFTTVDSGGGPPQAWVGGGTSFYRTPGTNAHNIPHGHPASPNGASNAPHGHPALSGSAGATGGTGNSNEIRPRNVAMCYIIKF